MDDLRWLVSDDAVPWLEQLAGLPQPSVAVIARLRQQLSPERVHLIVEQAALRARAAAKFPAADRMFFTEKGLQQASAAGIVGVLIALTGGAIYSPAGEASACLPPRKALCLPARCTGAAPSVSRLARIRARLPQAEACVPHPTE